MNSKGAFVISLDFELMWGMIDKSTNDEYGLSNVKNVPQVITQLLDLFDKYDIKSTFATVGLIYHKNGKEANEYVPSELPTYLKAELSPYTNDYYLCIEEKYKDLYYYPELISLLNKNSKVEIATHTFSHYYVWEKGQTLNQFDQDLKATRKCADSVGHSLESIIFPRNNVSEEYLNICVNNNIGIYRGNPKRFYNQKKSKLGNTLQRICRLIDTYIGIAYHNSTKITEIDFESNIVNIPASRFLRPFSRRLRLLEPLKVHRIKKEILYASKHGHLYHLWWHPHNFGNDIDNNIKILEEILIYFKKCQNKYGIESHSMKSVVDKYRNIHE